MFAMPLQLMCMSPRTIRLRRPVTLSVQEGVFVPHGERGLMDKVDRRWDDLCRSNPAYFDGRVYHVIGVHRNGHGGAVLHVMDCAYRFLAVQDDDLDLGVRALGVKGITSREGMLLMGLRAPTVAFYRDMWEFAPGGSVCPGDDPAQLIREELQEETGLNAIGEPTAVAVIFDPVLHCWEIVFRLAADTSPLQPRPAEYLDLQWRRRDDLPTNLSPIARQIAAIL
jgi:8-oxo-dGTP pyrophosphatase MutT (NUDIX family)